MNLKPRTPKAAVDARCCWICGKLGGIVFTSELRALGYDVRNGFVGHAHTSCIIKAKKAGNK